MPNSAADRLLKEELGILLLVPLMAILGDMLQIACGLPLGLEVATGVSFRSL